MRCPRCQTGFVKSYETICSNCQRKDGAIEGRKGTVSSLCGYSFMGKRCPLPGSMQLNTTRGNSEAWHCFIHIYAVPSGREEHYLDWIKENYQAIMESRASPLAPDLVGYPI